MVKQFLKIAGVKTQSEFYKKYPSEEAFFRAHPEARNLANNKMANGGGIYAYQTGGEPVLMGYPDYESFQAAHNAWASGAGTQAAQTSSATLPNNMPAPMVFPDQPMGLPNGANNPPQRTVSRKGTGYSGVSIVDYLNSIGMPSDYQSRAQMAHDQNISNYPASNNAAENLQLLAMLRAQAANGQRPMSGGRQQVISNSTRGATQQQGAPEVEPTAEEMEAYRNQMASQNPYVKAPGAPTPPAPVNPFQGGTGMIQDENGNWILPAAALAGTAAATYGLGKAGALKFAKSAGDLSKANLTTDQLIGYAKKFGRDPETTQLLRARGMKEVDIAKALKGVKLPAAPPVAADIQEVVKTTAKLLDKIKKGTEAENLVNAQRLVQVLKDKKLPRNNEVLAKLAELVPNPAKRMELLKGVGFPKAAQAAKAVGLGDRIFGGLKALGESKMIAPAADAVKGFFEAFHREGGQPNVPQHGNPGVYADGTSGTFSGGQSFQAGGSYNPTSLDYSQGLPHFDVGATMPEAMYGMAIGGPTYSDVTQYNHQQYVPAFDWMADGGSPLYSTQGQALRNFMNTVAYTPGGWMPNHFELPKVGRYQDGGGMSPDQAAMMAQQQGQQAAPQQGPPQQGGGIDPQQVMQEVAQMLQQGAQPEQIMQQLAKEGIPQDVAQQIIQQVMQQMQGGQGQQQAAPQQGQMAYGGTYSKGGEYDMSHEQVQDLINKGYKIEYL